jgi:hypothetical protein
MKDAKPILSTLWLVYVLNSAYGDISTLYNRVYISAASTIHYTQAFILFGALLVEPAIIMVLLARILDNPANRRLNMIVAGVLTAINVATLFVGTPTLAYAFITTAMIATGVAIFWYAWKWAELPVAQTRPLPGGESLTGTPTIGPVPQP